VAYGRLIPEETLALARLGFLNVHFSLLPKYRGAAPVQWALLNGERTTGVTLFWLDKGMDTGPVFLRREEPVLATDDAASLFARLSAVGADLLAEGLRRAAAGDLVREPQAGEPSAAPKLLPSHARIDFAARPRPSWARCGWHGPRPASRCLPDRQLTVQVLAAALPPRPAEKQRRRGSLR
jgi:methionyl-tRNA formyltransferase